MELPDRVVEAGGRWGVEPLESVVPPELTAGLSLERREAASILAWLTVDVYTLKEEDCPEEHCSTQPQMTWAWQLSKWVWSSQLTEECWKHPESA